MLEYNIFSPKYEVYHYHCYFKLYNIVPQKSYVHLCSHVKFVVCRFGAWPSGGCSWTGWQCENEGSRGTSEEASSPEWQEEEQPAAYGQIPHWLWQETEWTSLYGQDWWAKLHIWHVHFFSFHELFRKQNFLIQIIGGRNYFWWIIGIISVGGVSCSKKGFTNYFTSCAVSLSV